jgi:hypothetical protein
MSGKHPAILGAGAEFLEQGFYIRRFSKLSGLGHPLILLPRQNDPITRIRNRDILKSSPI